MFIRVVTNKSDSVYECHRVHIKNLKKVNADEVDTVRFDLEYDNGNPISIIVEKKDTEVYLMNDNGQTIDKYKWSH